MTAGFYTVLFVFAGTLLSALSLGSPLFYLFSLTLLGVLLYAVVSVLLARRLVSFTQRPQKTQAERGAESALEVTARLSSILPTGPVSADISLPEGRFTVSLQTGAGKTQTLAFPFILNHVGVFEAGVERLLVTDIFGLLRLPAKAAMEKARVVSLPLSFQVDGMAIPPRDDGAMNTNRSGEDITSPEDTRAYRRGDALKRIHWKLSQRAGELIVRRFEVPAPPDTLILTDFNTPTGGESAEDGVPRLRDTVCETALSCAKMQMEENRPVRLPLYGSRKSEFHADHPGSLDMLKQELACQSFSDAEPFHKTLNVELRRMRRTGAAIVITTRLDAAMVEAVKNIRRSGPAVRFYYITFTPDAPESAPYVSRLQHHFVEVCYVTPA